MMRPVVWLCVVVTSLLAAGSVAAERQAGQGGDPVGTDDATAVQRFVLNPGWNLVTFQVLPDDSGAESVFSRVIAADGSGRPLFDPANAAASPLKAAFALEDAQDLPGGGARFRWRPLPSATFTDPGSPPPGQPMPDLLPDGVEEVHARADGLLEQVVFGEAYLLLVTDILQERDYEISGTELAAGGAITLNAGWNLVGFPFDVTVEDQPRLGIASFFGEAYLSRIERLAEWDSRDARYWSYVPDRPEESRLYFLSPNQGYWVRVTDTVTLAPALVVLAPADEDLPPLQSDPIATRGGPWAPGPEDTESSPSGVTAVFDSAATQGWLRVRRHEVALQLPLRNNGGGAMGWSAELRPFTGAVPEGAVALDSAASVDDVLSLSARRGVLSTRTQVLEVAVNRTHLPPATYLAELSIRPSAGDGRRFLVAIEAGGLEGQWEGLISIDTVNGRRNAVPDIDVHLHVSADTLDGSRLLRGFIDSRETSLWPSDASFVGQMLEPRRSPRWREGYRRRFVLEGDVTLAPGDRNRFPFDRFPAPDAEGTREAIDPETGLPYLTNDEGDRLYHTLPDRDRPADFANPTQSFIARRFQFLGGALGLDAARHPLAPSPPGDAAMDGNVPILSGRYVETVTGLLNEPIRMEGRFQLRRVSASPYERRPLWAQPDGRPVTAFAGEPVTTTVEVDVDDDLLVDRAIVVVDQTAAAEMHRLTITAPDGETIVLQDRQRAGAAGRVMYDSGRDPLDARGLLDRDSPAPRSDLATYVVRPPRQSLDALRDRRAAGEWTLSWTHYRGDSTEQLSGWSLLLFGAPIARIAGEVVIAGPDASDPDRFADVELDVSGMVATPGENLVDFDRTTGRFEIGYLPPVRIDLFASKPGYEWSGISQLDDPSHPRGFRDNLGGFLAGGPGSDRLTVTLRPASRNAPTVSAEVRRPPPEPDWCGGQVAADSSPYRFVQGTPLVGFGGEGVAAGLPAETRQMQAQKTTVAVVDFDRVPLISADDNPSLEFSRDGATGEDLDLHPREFDRRDRGSEAGSEYAYRVIIERPDGSFGRLGPPTDGQPSRYPHDEGRNLNAPGQAVAIHSAIGGSVVNLEVSSTDGEYRIWVGASPGLDP